MPIAKFEQWMTRGSSLSRKLKQGSFGILALGITYAASLLDPGWVSYFISLPAFAVIAATATSRIVDMQGWELHHAVRRTGFLLMIAYVAAMTISPFTETPTFPSWYAVVGTWGLTMCWLTTPNMPPWWKWVSGQYKYKDPRMV